MKLLNPAVERLRPCALLCVLLLLIAELISRPFTSMGVSDDWSYIVSAQALAHTGHIAYNGWATAMLGWQLYAGALALKLFGDSWTAVRMSTLVISLLTTFLTQRTMVRSGISERNATIGTLALVLTPIYMQLSVTFMTDIQGLFAIVLCLYCCIRAIQTPTPRNATAWVCFAVAINVVLGSARQTGWLGALVIVPSTLWLLRKDRGNLLIGSLVTFAGWIGIYATMHWFARQPYALAEPLSLHIGGRYGLIYMSRQMLKAALETLFLILPLLLPFFAWARRGGKALAAILVLAAAGYAVMAIHLTRIGSPSAMLEPMLGDWFSTAGYYAGGVNGPAPIILGTATRIVITIITTLATICLIAFLLRLRDTASRRQLTLQPDQTLQGSLTWHQFWSLLLPVTAAYFALLLPRSTSNLRDRYLLALSFFAALAMLRLYQTYLRPRLPGWTIAVTALIALFSIACTHDLFSMSRAHVVIAEELQAAGIPRTDVDGGLEFNSQTELAASGYINDPRLTNPPHSFVPADIHRGFSCTGKEQIDVAVRHVVPRYGLAYTPDACGGVLPIAPVGYTRWLFLDSAQLYAVRYTHTYAGN